MLVTLLAAGCGPWRGEPGRGEPGRDEPGRGRDGFGAAHTVSAARGGRDTAALTVVSGATTVTVRAADLGDDLYRVSTPSDSALSPEVVESGGRHQLHLASTGEHGAAAVEVLLNREVRWDLRFSGGAAETVVDMGAGRLGTVDFAAGSTRIETVLPRPQGTLTVRMAGGASDFLVRLPDGVPVRVSAGGGAADVTVDGTRHLGVAGGSVFSPPGWATATDRYVVDAVAGVSSLTVTHT
ncbi:hypothetical protein Cs7R123_54680 [Catellatospora sp. TT07R-123]|nr:hypothetical protein Cs7R123_54680 [Catellatospora sp. TT07R-123]